MSTSASNVKASEAGARDDSALLGKRADDLIEDEYAMKNLKKEPGETDKGQRVVPFSEVKIEKREAEEDPSKKVREGQIEL